MTRTLHVATYNIHKGFSHFNRRMMVHELRNRLRDLAPDIAFLQEVQGLHLGHAQAHLDWPTEPQHEFLAAEFWQDAAYGRNVVHDRGHHGNAILSRFPILRTHNQDVTHLRFERRGMLHCTIDLPGWDQPLHCVCVHLSLLGLSRRRQMDALSKQLEDSLPADAPLIIAGDFNDWSNKVSDTLMQRLGVQEAFGRAAGIPARSFPSQRPVLRLDRIYVRGFTVSSMTVHHGQPWARISDHAALSAHLLVD